MKLLLTLLTSFHTFSNHSRELRKLTSQIDQLGIVVVMWGSTIASDHFGFYCNPELQAFYMFMVRPILHTFTPQLTSPHPTHPPTPNSRFSSGNPHRHRLRHLHHVPKIPSSRIPRPARRHLRPPCPNGLHPRRPRRLRQRLAHPKPAPIPHLLHRYRPPRLHRRKYLRGEDPGEVVSETV